VKGAGFGSMVFVLNSNPFPSVETSFRFPLLFPPADTDLGSLRFRGEGRHALFPLVDVTPSSLAGLDPFVLFSLRVRAFLPARRESFLPREAKDRVNTRLVFFFLKICRSGAVDR